MVMSSSLQKLGESRVVTFVMTNYRRHLAPLTEKVGKVALSAFALLGSAWGIAGGGMVAATLVVRYGFKQYYPQSAEVIEREVEVTNLEVLNSEGEKRLVPTRTYADISAEQKKAQAELNTDRKRLFITVVASLILTTLTGALAGALASRGFRATRV